MQYVRLKNLRQDNDLTQQTIATYLNISRSAYKNYENGVRGIPTEVLSQLADYYHTSTDFLIGLTDEKKSYPPPTQKQLTNWNSIHNHKKYERIKNLRKINHLTQQSLADYLHVSRSAYNNYENGDRALPTEILSQLADYYQTSTDYLIGRTDEKKSYPPSKRKNR